MKHQILSTTPEISKRMAKEIIEDQQPIVVISGIDIVEILISAGVNSMEILEEWLKANW